MMRLYSIVVALVFLVLAGCSVETDDQTKNNGIPCTSVADCPAGQLCGADGKCKPPGQGACEQSSDCPVGQLCAIDFQCKDPVAGKCIAHEECVAENGDGYSCLSDGTCQADVECETTADCCPDRDPTNCMYECIGLQCKGTECVAGQTQGCYIGCHDGQKQCQDGLFGGCDAPPVLAAEVCDDNIDNDCNGQTDEACPVCKPGLTQMCEGPCGSGTQACDGLGQWSDCDADSSCLCDAGTTTTQECGSCGFKEASCGDDGTWVWSTICSGEGACAAGGQEFLPCGMCGQQMRQCDTTCVWGEWSECKGEGVCVPGETEDTGCGNCGSKTRVCQNNCSWGDYGTCVAGGGCVAGETQSQSCGNCGEIISTCDTQCGWQTSGLCENEGPCSPGELQTEDCGVGNCGSRTRSCGIDCEWGDWSDCVGGGVCAPGAQEDKACGESSQGICQMGTQIRTCNGTCQWNPWGSCLGAVYSTFEICGNGIDEDCDGADETNPDEYESNNSCGTAYYLGVDPDKTMYPTIDSKSDQYDFFYFKAVDGTSILGPEKIWVDVSDLTNGLDVDIYLYKGLSDCNAGPSKAIAKSVTDGDDDESLVWQEGFATGDDGYYYVEVSRYTGNSCYWPYKLHIKGLK